MSDSSPNSIDTETTFVDTVLFRTHLKNHINSLQDTISKLNEEVSNLENRVSQLSDERATAITEKQQAYEERNKLQDKVAQLEDQLEQAESNQMDTRQITIEDYKPHETPDLYEHLSSLTFRENGALTASVEDSSTIPILLSEQLEDRVSHVRKAAPALVVTDRYRTVSLALELPRLPSEVCVWDDSFELEQSWFCPTGTFAFGIVRSDIFGVAIYDGDEQRDFRGFSNRVDKSHSKGGFSQSRFEQQREEQISEHLSEVRAELDTLADIDQLILVGDEAIMKQLSDRADITDTTSASGEPKKALKQAYNEFWTVRAHQLNN